LIVGTSHPSHLEFGAAVVKNFREAKSYILSQKPSILVFGGERAKEFDGFCQWVLDHSPDSLWILATEGLSPSQLIQWNDFGPVHDFIEDFADPQFEHKIKSAFEAAGEGRQRRKLVELFEEQTRQFKQLSAELEARVDKRQKTLRKSLHTLDQTRTRLDSLLKALLGIHRAGSVLQMEESLTEALRETLRIEWVRVRFEHQSLLKEQAGPHILSVGILCPSENIRGQVHFAKAAGLRFKADEIDFLHELADALGLALSRLHALGQAETVKAQWQATFDSIPHALCVTNRDFEILKLNRAFQLACSSSNFRNLIGKNCFSTFFGEDVAAGITLTDPLDTRVQRGSGADLEHFEVHGQSLGLTHDEQTVRLIMMRSITEDVRIERRILESSKMAELGTIGSSIAHELNNPLGGMLSFLQLILLDLKPDQAPYNEIKQMESAALRCRDIVVNLLSFARKQDLGEFTQVDLTEVLDRAIKLVELQSKSKGIQIKVQGAVSDKIQGSGNALTQALCNLLQNCIDAIGEKLQQDPLFPGLITIRLDKAEGRQQIQIIDNGVGIRPELQSQIYNPHFTTKGTSNFRGMGLTVAYTIVNEHRGALEILSQHGSGTTTILSLPA